MYASFNARALGLRLTAAESIRLAADAGFGGIDVLVRDAVESGDELGTLRREMDDLGLRGGAFPFPFDWRGERIAFEDGLRRLPIYAEAATILGLSRTGTWVLPEAAERSGVEDAAETRRRTEAFHVDRLSRIAAVLRPFDIRFGLEVIGVESSRTGRGLPFIHKLAQLEGLRADIERAAAVPVGVVVDSWHLFAADEPIAAALAWGVDSIVWVHVADLPAGTTPDRKAMIDSVRGLPGEHGAVESKGLLAELQRLGYDGPVTPEPLAACRSMAEFSPRATAFAAAESLRTIWPG